MTTRTTDQQLQAALKVLAHSLGVYTTDDFKGQPYANIPDNALTIDSYSPGGGWLGRVMTRGGATPLGARYHNKANLLAVMNAVVDGIYFGETRGTWGVWARGAGQVGYGQVRTMQTAQHIAEAVDDHARAIEERRTTRAQRLAATFALRTHAEADADAVAAEREAARTDGGN